MSYLVHHLKVLRSFILAYTIAGNAANRDAGIKDNLKCFLPKRKY